MRRDVACARRSRLLSTASLFCSEAQRRILYASIFGALTFDTLAISLWLCQLLRLIVSCSSARRRSSRASLSCGAMRRGVARARRSRHLSAGLALALWSSASRSLRFSLWRFDYFVAALSSASSSSFLALPPVGGRAAHRSRAARCVVVSRALVGRVIYRPASLLRSGSRRRVLRASIFGAVTISLQLCRLLRLHHFLLFRPSAVKPRIALVRRDASWCRARSSVASFIDRPRSCALELGVVFSALQSLA